MIRKLGKSFGALLASLCELPALQNIENEWEKDAGDMAKEQVGLLIIVWQ